MTLKNTHWLRERSSARFHIVTTVVNIFIKSTIKIFKTKTNDVKINERQIHSIRFADYIVIAVDKFINTIKTCAIKNKFKKNKNTNSRQTNLKMHRTINLYNIYLLEVKLFCHLCNYITQDNKYSTEIKRRIVLAKRVFIKKKKSFRSRHLSI